LKNNKQNKLDPVVVLKSKNKQKKQFDAKSEIRNRIDPEIVPVTGMINGANGNIIIQCKNIEATELVKREINEHFGEDFETVIPDVKKSRIKIVGVYEDETKCDENKYCEIIKNQNNEIFKINDYLKIVKIEEPKYKKFKNLIAEIEPEIYRPIMSVGKLNVRWNRCNVYDAINVRRCLIVNYLIILEKIVRKIPCVYFVLKIIKYNIAKARNQL
jgi:hypothetical protein